MSESSGEDDNDREHRESKRRRATHERTHTLQRHRDERDQARESTQQTRTTRASSDDTTHTTATRTKNHTTQQANNTQHTNTHRHGQTLAAKCQCSGTETFEKVTRTTVRGITGIPLFSNAGNTVTSDCLSRCRQSRSCSGFLLNYDRESCFRLDRVAYSSGAALQPTLEPINFFEKISSPCGKDWMLERVVGFEIEGYDDIVLNNVPDRLKCAELCIREKGLQCRSAEYHTRDNVCRLSRQDRRTQPLSFRPASPHVMYIENQCAPGEASAALEPFLPTEAPSALPPPTATQQQQCEFEEFPAQDLGHGDKQIAVRSKEECLQACESEAAFNCRSFAWYERAGVSLGDLPGATWMQRSPCLDSVHPPPPLSTVELGCTVDAMTVHLNTPEPFRGRLFSRDFPGSCQSRDVGRTDTTLTIKFNDPECGVVNEGDGVYSNVVVVQHHPVIQRRGDKAIKLMCLFETTNKTVTDSFNFIVDNSINAGVATAIVQRRRRPLPRIRLRRGPVGVDRAPGGENIKAARQGSAGSGGSFARVLRACDETETGVEVA
ncbi:hypothetical protein C7M84_017930 [Penaeus vannamei]|uniref:Uncharacterized protein n=1 Tax=Penaeus vannamei TaxID=6689 RepID=A0A423SJ34_PENVA|nr:hypothetical protein C7M84_017930 [Penaeus vannamei]